MEACIWPADGVVAPMNHNTICKTNVSENLLKHDQPRCSELSLFIMSMCWHFVDVDEHVSNSILAKKSSLIPIVF